MEAIIEKDWEPGMIRLDERNQERETKLAIRILLPTDLRDSARYMSQCKLIQNFIFYRQANFVNYKWCDVVEPAREKWNAATSQTPNILVK